MKLSLKILLLLLTVPSEGFAQKADWQIDLFSFFDNNEFGHSAVQIPQTMAGVRLSPAFGLTLDSVHSLMIGASMLHEFGSNKAIGDFFPTAYYKFEKRSLRFLMGAFPRSFALDRYPRIFFQDSIYYYRPNINGMLLEFSSRKLFGNIWLDWTSRQSPEKRETFLLGYSGRYQEGIFYVQHMFYMFHFAGIMNPVVPEALHDNLVLLTSAGLDLSHKTIFDILDINGGWVAGLERARADNTGWIAQHGFLSEARIVYKRVGLFNTFYAGHGQMHFYNDHKNELYWGDPFYRLKTYDRSDFYIDFIKNDLISTRLIFSLHFAENRIYNEQSLKVSFNLNSFRLTR